MSKTLTPKEPVDGLMKNLERLDTRMMSSLARSYINHDARHILKSLEVPTLLIVGERDALAPPSHAQTASRLSSRIETYTVTDCTHLALIERPEEVHREVDSFLRHRVVP
jgi:pimeloyl-ACP methyl ester carboxylesterase